LSDDSLQQLLEVQAHFRLPSVGLVEKDLHVVRAIAAVLSVDTDPFSLVFGGGTALARAHRLVRRMSEDIDFKIVPRTGAPEARSARRRALSQLRARVSAALQHAGFPFDAADRSQSWARDEDRYLVWHLPYDPMTNTATSLRPTIKVELTYAPLRRPTVTQSVQSFVAEALGRPAEVPEAACVSLVETAAEKLVSLTRRTAMEMAGAGRDPDPTLVRHVYDLHMMRDLVELDVVAALARDIAITDAQEFGNQHPAYKADIAGETRRAVVALRGDALHRDRYARFLADMVYGDRPAFDVAMETVAAVAAHAWGAE